MPTCACTCLHKRALLVAGQSSTNARSLSRFLVAFCLQSFTASPQPRARTPPGQQQRRIAPNGIPHGSRQFISVNEMKRRECTLPSDNCSLLSSSIFPTETQRTISGRPRAIQPIQRHVPTSGRHELLADLGAGGQQFPVIGESGMQRLAPTAGSPSPAARFPSPLPRNRELSFPPSPPAGRLSRGSGHVAASGRTPPDGVPSVGTPPNQRAASTMTTSSRTCLGQPASLPPGSGPTWSSCRKHPGQSPSASRALLSLAVARLLVPSRSGWWAAAASVARVAVAVAAVHTVRVGSSPGR